MPPKFERRRCLVAALRYLLRKGGVLVGHGVTEMGDDDVNQVGPLPSDDSVAWAEGRIEAANHEFRAAGFRPLRIFEFPHYAASDRGYLAAARRFSTRWERSLYFGGLLRGGPVSHRAGYRFVDPASL